MTGHAPRAEFDRRLSRLHAAMAQEGIDLLVIGATDNRGEKGALRYVTDYRPFHRFAYCLVPAGGDPILALHPVLAHADRSPWIQAYHFGPPADAIGRITEALPEGSTIGLVGADLTMRVPEHAALLASSHRIVSADTLFERVRAVKTDWERTAFQAASQLADDCFARLLDVVRPGIDERTVHGAVAEAALKGGAEEMLFLCMSTRANGQRHVPRIAAPGSRIVDPREAFIFSIEIAGPGGCWIELARMIELPGAPEGVAQIARATHRAALAARAAVRPGASGSAIQAALEGACDPAIYGVDGASGHSIGLDIIERPLIARWSADATVFEAGMALALHPMLHRHDAPLAGYVADTLMVGDDGAVPLSRWALETYRSRS